MHVVLSSSAAVRLDAARRFVLDASPVPKCLIVSASRGAADDFARDVARERGATFGLYRFSLTQLAARLAAPLLARERLSPTTGLGVQAVAARALFDATTADKALTYFAPVAALAGIPARARAHAGGAGAGDGAGRGRSAGRRRRRDLAHLLERFDEQFQSASAVDRARFLRAATRAAADRTTPTRAAACCCSMCRLMNASERGSWRRSSRARPPALATIPDGDVSRGTRSRVGEARGRRWSERWGRSGSPPPRSRAPLSVCTGGSAAGRSARRGRAVLGAGRRTRMRGDRATRAARGAARRAFDRIAIALRAPQHYAGLLEHALERAGVPAYFERGTRRPHPAGRAFLALIAARSTICPRADSPSICRSARCRTAGSPAADAFPTSSDEVFGVVGERAGREAHVERARRRQRE